MIVQNVKMTVRGSKLLIEVDLAQDHGPSASGKTHIVASTQGNSRVLTSVDALEDPVGLDLGNMYVGLNVYKK